MERKNLVLLNPREYEHSLDRKALNALENTPGLDKVAKEFYKHAIERVLRIQYTGSYLKVTETHFPDAYAALEEACENIHLKLVPNMYVKQGIGINAFTVGYREPMIVVHRRALDWLNEEELLGLLGHEAGHIKSGHMLYHDMAQIIPLLGTILGQATLSIGKLVSVGLEAALFHWYRMSELTADRAGFLACQDYDAYIKLLMKVAGASKTSFDKLQTDEFIKQAREFRGFDYDGLDKIAKAATVMWQTHPWTVMRAHELIKWSESGKFDEIVEKHGNKDIEEIEIACIECGHKLSGTETFCGVCGSKVWIR